jgi:hypothetical protein
VEGNNCPWRNLWERIVIASAVLGGPCTRLCMHSAFITSMLGQIGTSISRLLRIMSEEVNWDHLNATSIQTVIMFQENLPISSPKVMMRHPETLTMIISPSCIMELTFSGISDNFYPE